VNGDGYDDILVGARRNDDGGLDAGKTYLVLGKASGWAMDMNLTDADASFYGENGGDYSGFSVAGAGDVNSDGYDDILIGAFENCEAGDTTGQTYLILGKASGWTTDINLSNADASFCGEEWGDQSGWSVAGGGDVNGNGADDMLIGAYCKASGGRNAGKAYVIFGVPSDIDNDGVPDFEDAFPEDIAASRDTDGDGYPDMWNAGKTNADSTTGLWLDAFPEDIAASMDTDRDGFPDEWNPGMSVASNDTDGDGHPDEWNAGRKKKDSTTGLKIDQFPDDPEKWEKKEESPNFGIIGTIMAILAVQIMAYHIRTSRNR
jgi:hypothetical protein